MSNKAIKYVIENVIEPALDCDDLDKKYRNKVVRANTLLSNFKRSGDMFKYLQRFENGHGTGNDELYKSFKQLGLTTFEDIYHDVKTKFKDELDDITVLEDFIIGEVYSSFDIAIFAKTYDVQSGIYLVGEDYNYQAIFIKVTLEEGKYPNKWITEGKELKYYMYSNRGNFDINYKYNQAIINSKDTPIYVFIKNGTECKLEGIFKFIEYYIEEDDKKWFRLTKEDINNIENTITIEQYNKEFEKSINKSKELTDEELNKNIDNLTKPQVITTVSKTYKRNPDVVVATLRRANGYCEKCGCKAPFIRMSDNTPYLEVHHKVALSEGGFDNLDNTIAVCPNCHRELHFGIK